MYKSLLTILILWCGSVAAAQYKCGDEWVDYWPCDAKDAKAQVVDTSAAMSQRITFEGAPEVRLAAVAAEMESIQIDARKCDWDLKVETGGTGCLNFIGEIGPDSRNSQTIDELGKLATDESFYNANRVEFKRLYDIQLEILKVARLFNSRNGG